MKTYKEKHVYVDDSSLEDEDWITLRKIMRQISCCEVDGGELEGIRREIIGMAKEARVRGRSLREEIGESERTFAEEIFRASTGREMAPGRKQLKGVGIFFHRVWHRLSRALGDTVSLFWNVEFDGELSGRRIGQF